MGGYILNRTKFSQKFDKIYQKSQTDTIVKIEYKTNSFSYFTRKSKQQVRFFHTRALSLLKPFHIMHKKRCGLSFNTISEFSKNNVKSGL